MRLDYLKKEGCKEIGEHRALLRKKGKQKLGWFLQLIYRKIASLTFPEVVHVSKDKKESGLPVISSDAPESMTQELNAGE